MYSAWGLYLGLGLLSVWLTALSYILLEEKNRRRKFFTKNGEDNLEKKLNEILEWMEESERKFGILNKSIKDSRLEGLQAIQKVELMRYNPYADTGGEQSFTLVLLDGKTNGTMITSLHSRSGTRIYAKDIRSGQSEIELSKEEKEVLKRAVIQ